MVDICTLALDVGATFVARSFSGDAKQLVPLLKAAIEHRGTAVIDIISPCITFNNHDGSTKSYTYVKEHDVSLQELGFIAPFEETTVDYSEGSVEVVQLPDGSKLTLKKLNAREHNVQDRLAAMKMIHESSAKGEILTGLFYINEEPKSLIESLSLPKKPLSRMKEADLRPSKEKFEQLMAEFR